MGVSAILAAHCAVKGSGGRMADNNSLMARLLQLPAIANELRRDGAKLTARREKLIAARAAAEKAGAARADELLATRILATRRREAAEAALLDVVADERGASAALDSNSFQTRRAIEQIDDQLRASAGSAAQAAISLGRQLRGEHSRLRAASIPIRTETRVVETRDGSRKETVPIADLAGRAAELAALVAASREAECYTIEIADIEAILSTISSVRQKFGLPSEPTEAAA